MRSAVLLVLAAFVTACDSGRPSSPASGGLEAGLEVRFPVAVGRSVVRLRLAVTDLEKARGLMGAELLAEDEGMAFLYQQDQRLAFWMKDTPQDLDIGFVDGAGVVREIRTMKAFDQTTVESRGESLRLAVEMRAGWFARSGVGVGDKLDVEALRRGLTARGFDSSRYLP